MEPLSLPEYPYSKLDDFKKVAGSHPGGVIDLSIGTPCDLPPNNVVESLSGASGLNGYPSSSGSSVLIESCSKWINRTFDVELKSDEISICVGTKEMVASLPHFLKRRDPSKDTVLYPELSYPTYAMGALIAGCRAVPVQVNSDFTMNLESIEKSDLDRALLLWTNSPGNPAGQLEDLEKIYSWSQAHGVLVASDECYCAFTYASSPRSILQSGKRNVLAIHSLSKRSNLAGARVGFYCGDPEIVSYLSLLRMHAGLMVAGPIQEAAALAYDDEEHVLAQKYRYTSRLESLMRSFSVLGCKADFPGGGLYLWAKVPEEFTSAWDFAGNLASSIGVIVSPGDLYGRSGSSYIRVAAVQPDEKIFEIEQRILTR